MSRIYQATVNVAVGRQPKGVDANPDPRDTLNDSTGAPRGMPVLTEIAERTFRLAERFADFSSTGFETEITEKRTRDQRTGRKPRPADADSCLSSSEYAEERLDRCFHPGRRGVEPLSPSARSQRRG